MKNKKVSIIADISYLVLVFLLFGTVAFVALDSNYINVNIAILALTSIIMVVTYFTNLVIGLSAVSLALFAGLSTVLYLGITKGFAIPNLLYFWCGMLPAFTVCAGFLTKNTKNLQKTVLSLEQNVADLVTIDDLTGLKNEKQFISDAEAYMHISKRYNLKLALMVAELRYQSDVERIAGKQNMDEIIENISDKLAKSVRSEDLVYIVDTEKYLFAVLMITNTYDGINIAVERTRNIVSEINMNDITRFANVNLDMRIGFATMEKEYETPLDFIAAAKNELQYDV